VVGKSQHAKAESFRALHDSGVLKLPNAWDAGSAAVIAQAGAAAIATTSGGVAWSAGRPDGQHLTRAEMIEQVRRIVAAVGIPVTADVEGGYGPGPEDVGKTVEAVVAAGAVGVNIEDSATPSSKEPSISAALTASSAISRCSPARWWPRARHLRANEVTLPGGAPLTVEAFQSLGRLLGSSTGSDVLHYLLEDPFARRHVRPPRPVGADRPRHPGPAVLGDQ
jgi:hypothetical protein